MLRKIGWLLMWTFSIASMAQKPTELPQRNIVFILSDDHGYRKSRIPWNIPGDVEGTLQLA